MAHDQGCNRQFVIPEFFSRCHLPFDFLFRAEPGRCWKDQIHLA
jgi:hypothetical protein